jgi:hypothetical protein
MKVIRETRNQTLSVRITPGLKRKIELKAKEASMSISEYVENQMMQAVGGSTEGLSPEEIKAIKALVADKM